MDITSDKIIFRCSDGEKFEVERAVAAAISPWVKRYMDSYVVGEEFEIPLPLASSKIFSKVLEYCKKHVGSASADKEKTPDEEIKNWDAEFVKVDLNTLFDLILAAESMDIQSLLDLTCQTVADMIKGKTAEEIRKTFNIKNNFNPEEEEDQWAIERMADPWTEHFHSK